ncbi:MAG: dTMP kinase [Treponema sp.]|jgi:dTMP kinase|nr:dTMP kinase [Treponema sp.]
MGILTNFIVFEGIDGSGTSTQIDLLKKKLAGRETENRFVFTCEPTGEATGRFLRTILSGEEAAEPETAAFLFAADRWEHLYGKNSVVKALNAGKTVISDRYFFSSLAYQSAACGRELPKLLNSLFPLPEKLFFFDIDPALSLARIAGRSVTEIYEKRDFLEKTAAEYRLVIAEYEQAAPGMKIIRLDAAQSMEQVSRLIWEEIGA